MHHNAFTATQSRSLLSGWGEFRPEWIALIEPFIRGQEVWALGCGYETQPSQFLKTTHEIGFLLTLGASKVYAVDSALDMYVSPMHGHRVYAYDASVTLICAPYANLNVDEFNEGRAKIPVLFTKFPPTPALQWAHLLNRAEVIVYVGLNDNNTACGDRAFWTQAAKRQVLDSAEGVRSNLIIYGKPEIEGVGPRPKEEQNGIANINYNPFAQKHRL
jgi:hypothetical protein